MSPRVLTVSLLLSLWAGLLAPVGAELVNVAGVGRASQSTNWGNGQFPASLAIDGKLDTFSHTDSTTANNYWLLEFPEEFEPRQATKSQGTTDYFNNLRELDNR